MTHKGKPVRLSVGEPGPQEGPQDAGSGHTAGRGPEPTSGPAEATPGWDLLTASRGSECPIQFDSS